MFFKIITNTRYIMAKTLQAAKWVVNIILGLGCWLVVNESETFIPNLVGLACAALLIVINRERGAR